MDPQSGVDIFFSLLSEAVSASAYTAGYKKTYQKPESSLCIVNESQKEW